MINKKGKHNSNSHLERLNKRPKLHAKYSLPHYHTCRQCVYDKLVARDNPCLAYCKNINPVCNKHKKNLHINTKESFEARRLLIEKLVRRRKHV